MLRRFIWLIVGFPAALLLLALGVVNDQPIRLVLDPFRPADPVIAVRPLPFFVYFFGALIVGVIIGGVATWTTQARWRRSARQRAAEAHRWQAEADRLSRERERELETSRQLAPAGR